MLRFVLLAVMSLPVTPALAEISVTNDRGGSVDISRDCTRTVDQVSCTRETLLTGPEGKTALKTRIRTAERDYLATSVTVTGPQGNTRTRDRSFTRGE